jgi:hypothetical protein
MRYAALIDLSRVEGRIFGGHGLSPLAPMNRFSQLFSQEK